MGDERSVTPAVIGTHPDDALAHLARMHAATRPAADAAHSADARASMIAAAASVVAGLSLSGAALMMDASKWPQSMWVRGLFGAALMLSVGCFLGAAVVSVRVHRLGWPLSGMVQRGTATAH